MRITWTLSLVFFSMAAAAQAVPQQQEVLRAMRLANTYFMTKWPDPRTAIATKASRPGHIRADAIYYDGLMALYSIDPDKKYYDYAVKLGAGPDSMGHSDKWDGRVPDGRVLAALVRTLSLLPVGDAHRPEYLQSYLDMIKAIAPLQRADGYWNVSLPDSTHFAGKELTGTALFTYGIAWGIREGYLDKKAYLPIVAKAWNALVTESLHPDGMLDYVQGTDKEPDYGFGCLLLAGSEVYQIANPPAANLDESKVPPYTEPKLSLTTVNNWEQVQRPQVYALFEKNVYGRMPGVTIPVTYTTETVDSAALDGLAIKKVVTIHFSATDTAARLQLVLYLPKKGRTREAAGRLGQGRAPVFVGYSFTSNSTVEGSSQWPLKEILGRGYGVAVAWYWDIEPDRADGWQTGIRTRLAEALHIQPYEWSALGAWAWGLERMADYLATDPLVDPRRLIVIGHSRLGKAAVWAGASDKRFALVVSNESGEGGAALSKRDYGETIAIINDNFPWWFVPAYKQYGNNTAAMPFDQYMLLGLIAPRPLYVASAVGDQWSDPKGEFLSAHLAGPFYRLYHEAGIGQDTLPPLEHPVGEFIRYHIRNGKHDITLYDWQRYMDFADWRMP
jgi:Glycosyl Hydrolase Family 88